METFEDLLPKAFLQFDSVTLADGCVYFIKLMLIGLLQGSQ